MATEWAAQVNATSKHEMKGAEDRTIRGRYFLAKLKKEGRISMNHSGLSVTWQIEVFETAPTSLGDGGTLTFARSDRHRKMEVDWRGYYVSDMMTKKQKLMNRGIEQLIDYYGSMVPNLTKDITNKFNQDEVFIDGNASGNGDRLHGMESFLADDGATVAADKVAAPGDSYGGHSTAVTTFGGTWSSALATPPNAVINTDWPEGNSATPEYDASSPKLINWSSNNWGTDSATFEDNCERVIRYARSVTRLTGGKDGSPGLLMLDGGLYRDFLNKQQSVFRNLIPHKEADDLGFSGEYMNFEGALLMDDFGVDTNIGYGINFQECELNSMQDQLFVPDGPEYSIQEQAWLFAVLMFGNFRWNPKGFYKLFNYAS